MYAVRRWSVRRAAMFEWLYQHFENVFVALHPLWLKIGYNRVEKPITAIEKRVKGFLFDCKMCGRCVLSSTGMSCPMNCPKELRNGPCGGVRTNGYCEVRPNMRCVWVEAWEGSRRMRNGRQILSVQSVLDRSQKGRSSWLREVRRMRDEQFFEN